MKKSVSNPGVMHPTLSSTSIDDVCRYTGLDLNEGPFPAAAYRVINWHGLDVFVYGWNYGIDLEEVSGTDGFVREVFDKYFIARHSTNVYPMRITQDLQSNIGIVPILTKDQPSEGIARAIVNDKLLMTFVRELTEGKSFIPKAIRKVRERGWIDLLDKSLDVLNNR